MPISLKPLPPFPKCLSSEVSSDVYTARLTANLAGKRGSLQGGEKMKI